MYVPTTHTEDFFFRTLCHWSIYRCAILPRRPYPCARDLYVRRDSGSSAEFSRLYVVSTPSTRKFPPGSVQFQITDLSTLHTCIFPRLTDFLESCLTVILKVEERQAEHERDGRISLSKTKIGTIQRPKPCSWWYRLIYTSSKILLRYLISLP
jgi:hypothetical protein